MNQTFYVRLFGCSTFAIYTLQVRCPISVVPHKCTYSRQFNSVSKFCRYTSDARFTVPVCARTIFPVKEDAKDNLYSNITDDCLDYSQFSGLADDSEVEKKIKLIIMEYEVARQSGEKMPSTITIDDMKELLQFPSQNNRARYLHYLFKKEKAILAEKRKKEKRRLEYEEKRREREANQPGPKNTFFLHIRKSAMLTFYNMRLAHSAMFGSTVVFDMGYEEFMSKKESMNCAKQISIAYGANKIHSDPFNIYLCNAKRESKTMQYVANTIPHLYTDRCMINTSELSYLDIFPKERIVYLTPNAQKVLNNFDPDDIYIIGGFVDKSYPKPLSMAKAKRENIRMVKLPLDHHLCWGLGTKSLTVNQVMEIMLELKITSNWKEAFKFVPSRKLQKGNTNVEKIAQFEKKQNYISRKFQVSLFTEK